MAYYCNELKNIVTPDSITKIGYYAFCYCSSLETVILGKNLNEINVFAFKDCSNLKCVYFLGDTSPTSYASNAFEGTQVQYVMILDSYQSEKFCTLEISKGSNRRVFSMAIAFIHGVKKFSKSNSFTKSNTFTESKTFTGSNIFTESNTFTKSNTFTNSFTKSSTFTVSNKFNTSADASEGSKSNSAAIGVSVSVVAFVVVAVIVVLLIYIHYKKHNNAVIEDLSTMSNDNVLYEELYDKNKY